MSDNQHETDTASETDAGTESGERYKIFHTQGRWQGQPLRVEETGEAASSAAETPEVDAV